MDNRRLIGWLLSAGGPAVRYRTALELAPRHNLAADCEQSLDHLLRTDRVQWLLGQLDRFQPLKTVDLGGLNRLHGMKPECLENVVARLLELGLRAGVAVFDGKMDRFRQYVDNRMVQRALEDPDNPTVEGGRAVFVATVLASYFMRAGYDYPEVWEFVTRRIERLSHTALDRTVSIHLDQSQLAGVPARWAGKPIIRPELDPLSGTKPLPLIHDFFALAYLPSSRLTADARAKVDAIVRYGTSETYRSFPDGYGYIWWKTNPRMCYGCGWSLDLPDPESTSPYHQRKLFQRLDLLARLPAARESSWFRKGLQLVEGFKTETGTYCCPRAYLVEARSGYYVGGEYMGLEESRRSAKALELESTFRVLLLKQLVHAS